MPPISPHTSWLNLLDVAGPFLSPLVLKEAFPQGLPELEAGLRRDLRLAMEEWEEADSALHEAWLRFVLTHVLDWPEQRLLRDADIPANLRASAPEQGEVLRPDLVLINPATWTERGGEARVLICLYPREQSLESPVPGRQWKASPATRMLELLHGAGVTLGLLSNGAQWMLVHAAPGESAGYITWHAHLLLDEPLTLRAFVALLGAQRLFNVPDEQTLEALLRDSAARQQEVTEALGMQVRASVEILVQSIDRLDADHHGALLVGIAPARLYEAAVTVMMRLVFLLSAEERGLLLLGTSPLYDRHYAASTLAAQLRETADRHGEELLERRHDAWARLLALFRAVFGGMRHEDAHLPAYGGALFDPDRFPFLEGRAPGTHWRDSVANPLAVNNRTVLHVLESVQYLVERDARGGAAEPRRLSFAALDIEQIGHVYESLLDHTVLRAPASRPVLGLLGRKGDEPEVDLGTLEQLAPAFAHGDTPPPALMNFLVEQCARSAAALARALATLPDAARLARLRAACGQDEQLYNRVLPWAGLLRDDSYGRPVLIPPGAAYVTQGSERRQTGTHYTPRSLTEEMVRHTLEPLLFEGCAEGQPRERWRLLSPEGILALRVCDPAVGSAAFLVQACRWLGERLAESWELHGAPPDAPADAADRLLHARRLVAEQCLYGVDRNPLAVQMARLSLWLVTMAREKPFTFLDHAIRCGDSLLGFATMAQVETAHPAPAAGMPISAWQDTLRASLEQAAAKRRGLERIASTVLDDARTKRRLLDEADATLLPARWLCDAVLALALRHADGNAKKRNGAPHRNFEQARAAVLASADDAEALAALRERTTPLLEQGNPQPAQPRRPLHWPLEFPEVFEAGGFDAILSNPPFQGGKKITGPLGTDYRFFLQDYLAGGEKGNADLSAYFFLRAGALLRQGGCLGMLATNTIAQGDTREVGLDRMTAEGYSIYRAVRSRPWPGAAALEIAQVWMRRGGWAGAHVLDGVPATGISPYLAIPGRVQGKPKRLKENVGKSFQGSIVLGKGFILSIDEAQRLLDKDARNKDVLYPYLTGEDLNSRPDQSPSRWVINFHDWPLERARDYPDVFRIVEEKVKPEREKLAQKNDATAKGYARLWWQYGRRAVDLYKAIEGMERVLVRAQVSRTHALVFVPTDIVISMMCVVLVFDDYDSFAVLQSSVHEVWVDANSSKLKTDQRYTPTDCFDTFPMIPKAEKIDAREYYTLREKICMERNIGMTKFYDLLKSAQCEDEQILRMRNLSDEINLKVLKRYGWNDLSSSCVLCHNKSTDQVEAEKREILSRLYICNSSIEG